MTYSKQSQTSRMARQTVALFLMQFLSIMNLLLPASGNSIFRLWLPPSIDFEVVREQPEIWEIIHELAPEGARSV